MNLKKKYKELNDKYKIWMKKPLPYQFKRMFYFLSFFYFLSLIWDFGLTYLSFRFTPAHFFAYEFSYPIKMVARHNPFWASVSVVIVFLPLILTLTAYISDKKKYGCGCGWTRIWFMIMWFNSFGHIYGGFTNWVHLVRVSYYL